MALVYAAAAVIYGTDTSGEPAWSDRSTRNIMAMWGQALADVAAIRHADDDARLTMREQAGRIEWLLKWQLLEKLRRKIGSGWGDARIAAVDLKWAAIDPTDSIFDRLRAQTERSGYGRAAGAGFGGSAFRLPVLGCVPK
ncbi:MAG: proteasome accessory factor PafA2 family protein [Bifidobacterium sp.]